MKYKIERLFFKTQKIPNSLKAGSNFSAESQHWK